MVGIPLLPAVGLGTAPLGGLYKNVSPIDAAAAVAEAVGIGYRYFDTAPLYGYGAAERALGRGLEGCDAAVAVSTKVGRLVDEGAPRPPGDMFAGDSGAATWDFSADGVHRSLDASLQRLGRSYVDIAFIHDPDNHARQALDEAYPALERLRDEGVIGAIGVGMNEPGLPTRFVTDTDIDAVLIAGRYTLLDRSAEQALFSAAMARGVHVIAAGAYNSGILAAVETNPHFNYEAAPAEVVARVQRLQAVCNGFGLPLPAAAVQFVVRHRAVGTVLLGARNGVEAAENWAHAHTSLPEELWADLDEIINDADDVD
ncbi:MAG: aldo/keto reductase [bacterium]|nr:aldo/keto reductase [bacterium]MDE0234563.1 aldo/keto reductase [bacterium]